MYKLKQIPEDFIVKEINNVKIKDTGSFAYVLIKKKERNTLDVVKELAKQLGCKEKDIGFAGTKDKKAVTEQVMSLLKIRKERISDLKIENVSINFLGYGNDPLSLGDLSGNKFEIVVRNLENRKIDNTFFVENYFDEQRFSEHNVEIGRLIIKKQFSEAVKLIDNFNIRNYLKENSTDAVGALKRLPKKMLKMYIHAYQSYLWNETLASYLRINVKVMKEITYSQGKFVFVKDDFIKNNFIKNNVALKVPLIGFNDEIINGEFRQIILELMKKEQINFSDFVIKQIPEFSLEGESRNAFTEINDLKISEFENDDLNSDKKKVKVSFTLGKGSYATMIIRRLFS
ncbi:hypothetical protein COY27_00320 [Candidatus Woesearchaeota archaeon CG_4_10_14_0_2_um_filter_33_13]|nr:MAG: hypothetical protein COY27_00320 [Candidatus Woesearchaeota archaeon CG_4_10_14_0_2_um_filter_33_13]